MRKKDPQLAASPTSAVIYARFSSHNQKDESIEQQVDECKEYAERNGLKVTKVYADAAISGRTEARTQFQRLKADAKKGKFAVIIAYKSSRIARNMMNALCFKAVGHLKTFFRNLKFLQSLAKPKKEIISCP